MMSKTIRQGLKQRLLPLCLAVCLACAAQLVTPVLDTLTGMPHSVVSADSQDGHAGR
jgi:hypothetical protein